MHNSTIVLNGGDFKPISGTSYTRYSLDSTTRLNPLATSASAKPNSTAFRSLMHQMMNKFKLSESQTLQKQYTHSLRTSIADIKSTTKAKLATVNIKPPKVWDDRDRLKERAIHYTRQTTESRDRAAEVERDREKGKVQSKTRELMERIMKEREASTRKRNMREEKQMLEDAIELSRARASFYKGGQDISEEQ